MNAHRISPPLTLKYSKRLFFYETQCIHNGTGYKEMEACRVVSTCARSLDSINKNTQFAVFGFETRQELYRACTYVGSIMLYGTNTTHTTILCSHTANTLCSEKKHPLTFPFVSPWKIFRFPQNFQEMASAPCSTASTFSLIVSRT